MKQMILGILMEVENKITNLNSYYEYIYKKTGYLFFFCINATLLHFGIKDEKMIEFSKKFGTLYQIHDDLSEQIEEKNNILQFVSKNKAEEILKSKIDKINALKAYKTQFVDNKKHLHIFDYIRERAGYLGYQIGVRYAEGFINPEHLEIDFENFIS